MLKENLPVQQTTSLPDKTDLINLPPALRDNPKIKVRRCGRQIRLCEHVRRETPTANGSRYDIVFYGYVVNGRYYSVDSYKKTFDRFGNPRGATVETGPARNRKSKAPETKSMAGTSKQPDQGAHEQPSESAGSSKPGTASKRHGRQAHPIKGAVYEPGVSYQFRPRAQGGFTVLKIWSAYDPVKKNNHAYKNKTLGISMVKGDITNLVPTARMQAKTRKSTVTDLRQAVSRSVPAPVRISPYPFDIVILVGLVAVLSGASTCQAIASYWAQHRPLWEKLFPDFPKDDVSHDTVKRVIERIGIEDGNRMLQNFLCMNLENRVKALSGKIRQLHLDGQFVRAATNELGRAPDILNLYDSTLGMVVSHQLVGAKTNEIKHSCSIIANMNLAGCIITCDALNTQTEFAGAIIGKGGDYCFAVKGNHETEENDIRASFNDPNIDPSEFRVCESEFECAHGRIEHRRVRVLSARRMSSNLRKDWPGLDGGCLIEAETVSTLKRNTKTSRANLADSGPTPKPLAPEQTGPQSIKRYFISSLRFDAPDIASTFLELIRNHWSVETMHWGLDVVFGQDLLQCKSGRLVMGMSTIKKIVDYFLRQIQILGRQNNEPEQLLTRPELQRRYSTPETIMPILCDIFRRNADAGKSST